MKLIRDIENVSMRIYLYFELDGERISPRFAYQQTSDRVVRPVQTSPVLSVRQTIEVHRSADAPPIFRF